MSAKLDLKALSADLLADARNLLPRWLPGGKQRGKEFVCGSLSGDAGGSLSVNTSSGVWADFATGESGADLIDLYAAIHGMTIGEAYRDLTGQPVKRPHITRVPPPPPERPRQVISPVPADAHLHACEHRTYGKPSRVWQYENADGNLLGYVARYDAAGEKKQIVPWTYTPDGWSPGQWPEPRPLYGLQHLAARPDAPVLIVEGEKSVDAAVKFAGALYVVVTWPGGSNAWQKADWSPLAGRKILVWPDADAAGDRCAKAICAAISPNSMELKLIDPAGMPDGWDAADSGFDWSAFKAWASPRAAVFKPAETVDPETGEILTDPAYTGAPYVTPERAAERAPNGFTTAPVDVFAEIPAPPIDPSWLPPQIAAYAFDQAGLLAVSPEMIAMPAIVACAAAIHDGIEIQPKRFETSWREAARLWCAVVGPPSVRKSPSLKRALSGLRKINKRLCEENERVTTQHAAKLEDYKQAKREAKKTGETPTAPEEPVKHRLIVDDVTVEALSEILKHNPRGVLCIQDELTGWFGSMDAYSASKSGGNKDRAHWLEIYNGGHRMVDRVMRGHVNIPNWSACMVGGIQPDMMRRIASTMGEDGLIQRFMVVIGKNTGIEMDRPEDTAAKRAYSDLIDSLYALGPSDNPVILSEGAHIVRERIAELSNNLSDYSGIPSGLRSHMGKWSGLFARLLLTYHVIECVGEHVYPTARQVSEETAVRVENLMSNFLFGHAASFYDEVMGGLSNIEHIRWIAGHVLAHKLDRISTREITQSYRAWRSLDGLQRTRTMDALEAMGWLEPVQRGHRPNEWVVNSAVHPTFEAHADARRLKNEAARVRFENMTTAPTMSTNK